MKNIECFIWGICLAAGLLLSSCAGHKSTLPPQGQPAENLPQIGTRQAAIYKEAPRSKVLVHLIKKAEQQIHSEEPEAAFATLEKALGINAQDPILWHLMARVQLIQGNFDQAQQLAKKSNLLAVHNPSLKKKNLDIIDRSRTLQGMTR